MSFASTEPKHDWTKPDSYLEPQSWNTAQLSSLLARHEIGHHDQLIVPGKVIREEKDGLRVFVDLQKIDKASAVETLESILSRIRG